MSDYEVLEPSRHAQLRIDEQQRTQLFTQRHMVNIELKEAVQAAADFPLFISKVADNSRWAISALCGLAPGENVYVDNLQWQAQYTPLCLQTLPFIMHRQDSTSDPAVLIDSRSPVLSATHGEPLYLTSGRPTAYLNNKSKLLKDRVAAMEQTALLLQQLADLALFRPLDLVLQFRDESQQRVSGLFGIDEQALHALSGDQLQALNANNTLAALFNILGSVFQVNRLIRLHNSKFADRVINNIKLETIKQ